MGQAAIVLLATALLGMGGVADDAPGSPEEPLVLDPTAPDDVDASASVGTADGAAVEASLAPEGQAAVKAGPVQATADATGLVDRVAERVETLPIQLPHLPPTTGQVHIELGPGPEPAKRSSTGHVVLQQQAAASPAPSSPVLGEIAFQLAPAAAFTALAAIHVEPTLRGWRRLIPVAPWLPLYSRIARDDVLDHSTRSEVYELLKQTPGLSLQAIAEELDVSRSTVRHHVRVLEDNDLLAHTSRGRCRLHYPVGREAEALRRHLLANPTRAKVAETVSEGACSLSEIAEAIDANAGAVHFHLEKLCDAGLVERRENGSVTYEAATQALEDGVRFEPA